MCFQTKYLVGKKQFFNDKYLHKLFPNDLRRTFKFSFFPCGVGSGPNCLHIAQPLCSIVYQYNNFVTTSSSTSYIRLLFTWWVLSKWIWWLGFLAAVEIMTKSDTNQNITPWTTSSTHSWYLHSRLTTDRIDNPHIKL